MTVTLPVTDHLLPQVVEAVVTCLPGDGWSIVAEGVPASPGQVAVGCRIGDVELALVPDAVVARAVQVGPPPAEDVLEGLTPALEAAVAALGAMGVQGDTTAPAEVPSSQALAAAAGGDVAVVVLGGPDGAELAVAVHLPTAVAPPAPALGVEDFAPVDHQASVNLGGHPLELLADVELGVTAELGRTRLPVRDVLALAPGSVIELDRAAGTPIDLLVNGTLIARGEVVVVDEEFGVRVTEIIGHDDHRGHR